VRALQRGGVQRVLDILGGDGAHFQVADEGVEAVVVQLPLVLRGLHELFAVLVVLFRKVAHEAAPGLGLDVDVELFAC
jgi:hypothetical protein